MGLLTERPQLNAVSVVVAHPLRPVGKLVLHPLEPTVPVGNVEQRIPKDDQSFMISQCDVQPAVTPSGQRPASGTINIGGEQDRQRSADRPRLTQHPQAGQSRG